jgi:membrane-associated phospholipid phosphatase
MAIREAAPRGRNTVERALGVPLTMEAAPPRAVRLWPQIGVVAAAIAVYFLVRGATDSAVSEAVRNAYRLIDLEQALGMYHEPGLQRALAGSEAVRTVLNWMYIWGHWPVIVVTLLWLARRHPEVFRRTRNAMMLSGALGMVVFALFPVAPPRLAGIGMADTVTLTSDSYRVLQPAVFTNQFAAMPSLHAGWNLLIGLAIVTAARRPLLRLVGVLLPMAMVATVILTANHYIVDVLAGVMLTTACWGLVELARKNLGRVESIRRALVRRAGRDWGPAIGPRETRS